MNYQRTQILLEPKQRQALGQISSQEKRSLSEIVREMIREQLTAYKQRELEAAARALLNDYESDPELTALTALDSDDFHV